MRYSLIPIAMLLGACAADRSAAPVTMHSQKPAEAVADCIEGQWLASDVPYQTVRARLGEGFTVQMRADGIGPMVIADVLPDGSGATVNLRSWAVGDWNLEGPTRSCL